MMERLLYLCEKAADRYGVHFKIVRLLKILMFTVFAINAGRIAYRTWKYGGSKEVHTDKWAGSGDDDIGGVKIVGVE